MNERILQEIQDAANERGISLERILEWLKSDETIIIDGDIFPTFHAACKAFDVEPSYLYKKATETDTSAVQLLKEKVESNCIKKWAVEYDGVPYPSFSELCRAKGLDPQIVLSFASNRSVDRFKALEYLIEHKGTFKSKKRTGFEEIVDGVPYSSRKAVYRKYKLTSTQVLKYIKKHGCSFEAAVLAISKEKASRN
mgnify:CR=1 FL=1